MATHLTLCVFWYGGCYFVVKRGIDVKRVLNFFKVSESKFSSGLGTYGIAFGLYKILMPARLLVTAAIVPVLASYLGKDDEEGAFAEDESEKPPIDPKNVA